MAAPINSPELTVLVGHLLNKRASWDELIKTIRGATRVDIFTAEKIALSHPGWRRFCNDRIRRDPECRKRAAYHVRVHGTKSLLASDGQAIWVVEPER